jgi:vanillate O-demethylase ferredoxin subunit
MKMAVSDVRSVTDTVKVFTFHHPRRAHLPPPLPGSHVDLHLPDGKVRQYSLCGDPDDDTAYAISVKLEYDGRAGSKWIHDNLKAGAILPVSAPRNNFALVEEALRHVFVAGGIGITPMLAMLRRLARRGAPFELHYCARAPQTAPFLSELTDICSPQRLFTYFSDLHEGTSTRFDAERIFAAAAPGTHVYCCGPQRLTQAVRAATGHWPDGSVHFEAFKPALDENFKPEPFDVKLASTGKVLRVPADKSTLEILRAHGLALPSSCELGVCGACSCRYLDGTVIHRDSILDISARQDRMMLCVSRARVGVTLDL